MELHFPSICKAPRSSATSSTTGTVPARRVLPKQRLDAFAECESGAVAIITGLTIPVLLGFAGLAVEYSQILGTRAQAQRTADFASHAGAVAYGRSSDAEEMRNAAKAIARLNGFNEDDIDVRLDPSIESGSGAAVRATITTPKPLYLPRLVGGDTSVDVVASAVAGAQGGDPACVQAIDLDGSGINMSGDAQLEAVECAVASNAAVEISGSAKITTVSLSYDAGSPPEATDVVKPDGEPAPIMRQSSPDPLEGSNVIQLAKEQMANTAALQGPDYLVDATAPDIVFGWSASNTIAQAEAVGCTASFADSEWTFLCPEDLSTVNIGRVRLDGGLKLRFNIGASQDTVYNISGNIDNQGARMIFGRGTYNVARGIATNGNSVTEFGAGSFRIGPSSGGDAIQLAGGADLYLGDFDIDHGGVFEITGRIVGEGNSCLQIPAVALHEINGPIVTMGAIRFGAGLYAINGYVHAAGGGDPCPGANGLVEAVDTTFLISGAGAGPGNWQCQGQAFCFAGDQSNVRFTAPPSGPFTDIALIGPLDPTNYAGAKFTAGASGGEVSGAFYVPNGPITVSGGASASGGSGGCLQLIGAEITISGGTSVASECKSLPQSGGGGGQVVLLR